MPIIPVQSLIMQCDDCPSQLPITNKTQDEATKILKESEWQVFMKHDFVTGLQAQVVRCPDHDEEQ